MRQRKVESAKDDPQQQCRDGKGDVGADDPHQQLGNDEGVRGRKKVASSINRSLCWSLNQH